MSKLLPILLVSFSVSALAFDWEALGDRAKQAGEKIADKAKQAAQPYVDEAQEMAGEAAERAVQLLERLANEKARQREEAKQDF